MTRPVRPLLIRQRGRIQPVSLLQSTIVNGRSRAEEPRREWLGWADCVEKLAVEVVVLI
jgi:hypothetical protein